MAKKNDHDHDDDRGGKHDDKRDDKGHDEHGGGSGFDLIVGTKGDDVLQGTPHNDILIGLKGNDTLLGGAGNDILIGDGGGGGWLFCSWAKPHGAYSDYLDGGAGNDVVLGGKGDDTANYTLSENKGAHDVYDGGKGFDTLQLALTSAELRLDSVQKDIAAFEAFLDRKADPNSDDGKTFQFASFDLDARNFEALAIHLINTPPVAHDDAYALDEDTVLLVAGPGVLANDSDDDGDPLAAVLVSGPAHGTLNLAADGSLTYAPDHDYNGADSFSYKANDGHADSVVATVTLDIAPVNDEPVAQDIVLPPSGGSGGTGDATTGQGGVYVVNAALLLAGATDAEGDPIFISGVSPQSDLGASVSIDPDGNIVYDPTEGLKYLHEGEVVTDSFTYTLSDGLNGLKVASLALNAATGGGSTGVVTLTVRGVNDAPEAADDVRATDEDTAIIGNLLANDSDPENDALTVLSAGTYTTSHGARLAIGTDGSFTYDPTVSAELQALAQGASVVDSFDYTVSDGKLSDTATLSVTVAGLNEPAPPSKVLPQVSPDATLDYYVRFDIDGGTGDWLSLAGFHVGASAPSSIGSAGGGGGAGKVSFDAVQMALGTSATVVALTEAIAAGQRVNAQVEAYAPSSKGGVLVDEYQLDTAFLAKLSTDGSPSGTSDEVSLNFSKITHTHVEQDATGKTGDTATVTYDVLKNTTSTADVGVTADAIKHLPTPDLSTDAQLTYYMTYDGAPGWLELSGFSMSLSNPTTIGSATGGAGAGKVSLDEAKLELGMSNEIVQLLANLTEGHAIKFLEVEAYSPGGKGAQLVDEYYFDTTQVTSLQTDGTANTLGIDAVKFSHGHVDYSETGAIDSTSAQGWDFAANKSWIAPNAPDADAAKVVPLSQVDPGATLDYYVRFDIDGGTGDWLSLAGFHVGASAPSSIGSAGGGGGAGKVSFDAVQMALGTSATVVALTEAIAAGQRVNAQVEAYAPSSKGGVLVDEYQLDTAFLAKLSTDGSPSGTSDEVSLNFSKITHTHVEQDATGKTGDTATVTYDVLKNTTSTADVGVTADAIKHLPTPDLSTDAQLTYYMTYDGAPGWLELSGFSMSLSNPTTIGSATGGAGAGKVSLDEAKLELGMSNEIVQLLANLTEGHAIKFLEVEAYSPGGKGAQLVDEYYFDTTQVTSLQTDGTANTLGIDAVKFSHGHVDYSETGAIDSTSAQGWDFAANKSWIAPNAPDADAAKVVPLSQVDPGATLDYYVRFDIDGGTGDWLSLAGFHVGASAPSSIGSAGGGGGAGKVSFDAVQMALGTSATVVALTEAIAAGQRVNAQVEAYAPSSKGGVLVDEYQLDTAFLAKLSTDGSPSGTSDEVSLNFSKITHTHVEQDATGKTGDTATVTYDVLKNTTSTADVGVTADAIKHLPTPDLSTDAQLTYYMTYDGAPGWLELSGFSMSLSNPTTIGSATGGAGAGKVSLDEAKLELGMSNEIVQLLANLTEGHAIKFLEVEAYSPGGKGAQLVDEYYFDTVYLNSLHTDGTANTLGIDAAKFSHGHVDYGPSGAVSGTVAEGWDFTHNTSWNHGSPHADLL